MHTIHLPGCNPIPLSAYLKSLGIFRILSEQLPDSSTQCYWKNGVFVLKTEISDGDLVAFFLNEYHPTPLVSPWNAGSGFYFQEGKSKERGEDGKKVKTGIRDQETEATRSISAVKSSTGRRFSDYRDVVHKTQTYLRNSGRDSAPKDEEKRGMVREIRNSFPDYLIQWIDAAFVFSGEELVPPPLLLSGGNEGNLDFSNTFIQNLLAVIDKDTDQPLEASSNWLSGTLFSRPSQLVPDSSSGYFAPSIRGGANSTTGFASKSYTNPWDFILTMEGIVLLTGTSTKKLASNKFDTSFPFCVKSSAGGFASGEKNEAMESKGEIWLPTWQRPSGLSEIKNIFSEGRATIGKRAARNGIDFAQAVVSLGVDRGFDSFYRYGILPRFGDSYFASLLQQISVQRDPIIADLLGVSEEWISQFCSAAKNAIAPGSIRRAAARLETAIFARAAAAQPENKDTAQEILLSLGQCERALAGCSEKWLEESFLKPIPPLPREWVSAADDNTCEYRLACALASLGGVFKREFYPLRRHLEPVKVFVGEKVWAAWDDDSKNEVVWNEGPIVPILSAIIKRRLILANSAGEESWPEVSGASAWPSDIAAFIEGRFDEERFKELLWGLCLVNFSAPPTGKNLPTPPKGDNDGPTLPAFFAQLKLCFSASLPDQRKVPMEASIFKLAASGDGARASAQALRRLHGSSVPVTHLQIPLSGDSVCRSAAALLFPLWDAQLAEACASVAPDLFSHHNQN
jgi:CRISPR-associated protein Csx17